MPEGTGVVGTGVAAANQLTAGPCQRGIAEQIRVMVVGSDSALAAALRDWMERSGMAVTCARTGAEAIGAALLFRPDVALVDLKLPDVHGLALIEHLKGSGNIAVIAVSDRNNEAEKAAIIEAGADDYITKPPPMRELVARVRAMHRRVRPAEWIAAAPPISAAKAPLRVLSVGPLTLDLLTRTLANEAGGRVSLTAAEFNLLMQLLSADGAAVSRHLLSEQVLRRPLRAEDRSIDQIVHRIRRKLSTVSQDAITILTEHRYGYRIVINKG